MKNNYKRSFKFFIPAVLLAGFICGTVFGAGIVKGRASATYEFQANRTAPFMIEYSNNGFEQTVSHTGHGTVSVKVHIASTPMNSSAQFPIDRAKIPANIANLSDSLNLPSTKEFRELSEYLTTGCGTEYEAVTSILIWISGNIKYASGDEFEDNAFSVYNDLKGDCVGRVNLAIALLGEVGIPARKVHGLCIDNLNSNDTKLGISSFHRWLEIYYSDTGWVFSDPGRSMNTVDPRYIVIDPDAANPYHIACHNVKKATSKDNLVVVDYFPEGVKGIIMRPNNSSRYSGAVVGILRGFPGQLLTEGKVSIFQNGKKTGSMKRLSGKNHFSFTELAGNRRYFMKIQIPGMMDETYSFSTAGDRLKVINIELLKDAG